MAAKNIHQPPLFDYAQSVAFGLAKKHSTLPENRVVHIARFRRNIEVAAKNEPLVCQTALIEIPPKASKPRQLVAEFLRADFRAVWDIYINYPYRPYHYVQETTLCVAPCLRKAATRIDDRMKRENGDAVVSWLSPRHGLISEFEKGFSGEALIGAFGLLQTHNVGPRRFQPLDQLWQANRNRIDIPGGDLHGLLSLVPREVVPDKKIVEPCAEDSTY